MSAAKDVPTESAMPATINLMINLMTGYKVLEAHAIVYLNQHK